MGFNSPWRARQADRLGHGRMIAPIMAKRKPLEVGPVLSWRATRRPWLRFRP